MIDRQEMWNDGPPLEDFMGREGAPPIATKHLCQGGGGKGGGQSTQYSGVTIPPEVLARYNKATDRAEEVSKTPWKNYEGQFVAPVNETQTAGYDTMMGGQSYTDAGWQGANQSLQQGVAGASPLYGQAGAQYNNALQQGQQGTQSALRQGQQAFNTAAPLTSGALAGAQPYQQAATGLAMAGTNAVDPNQLNLQQFLNPYQEQVTAATMAQLGQQQAQQRNDQRGNMIREGTFGGDRSGIANANMVNQQNMATGSVLSGLNQGNYNQALAAAQQQQGVGLGAAQANRAALQQGAGQMANIGQQGFQQGMGAAQQLYGQGMGLANLQGQMGQQAYGQGIGAGQALQGLGTAGYGMMSDAAARQAGFAGQAFGQNMQLAQGQTGFGTLQQQTQQAQDSAVYNQWLQERGYPFQTSQFYTNAVLGTGPLSGSQSYGGSFSPQPFFSDERVKEDISEIGRTHDGIPIIRFRYKGDDKMQIGLSAQDVEKKHPHAVGETPEGIKTVSYPEATDPSARPHRAIGGGADPFSGGLGGLAGTANIGRGLNPLGGFGSGPAPRGANTGFGSLPDIVALQKAALQHNAPARGGPPSSAGLAGPGMTGPGNPPPPPEPEKPAISPVVAAALVSAVPEAAAYNDPGGGGAGEGGPGGVGPGSDANAAAAAGATGPGGTGPGDGTGGGTGGVYADGGRAGFAGYGQSGAVGGLPAAGGFGGLVDLDAIAAMYGAVPWAKNPQGTGNAGLLGGGLQGALASAAKPPAMLKPAEMKAPAAQKATADQAGDALDKATKFGKGVGEAYEEGKDALYGSAAKGKPGDKDYRPETGGLFGKGGSRDRYDESWWHRNLGTDRLGITEPEATTAGVDFTPLIESRDGGRVGFAKAGEVAPFDETSVLDPELFAPRKASDPDDVLQAETKGVGPDGKKKDPTAGNVMKAAALGASLIPGVGPFLSAGLSAGSMFVKRGGRTYAEGGEVNDNQPEPGLAPAAAATGEVHYGIFSRSQGHRMIGRATTMSGARRVRTQRDSAFGGSDHFIKPIPVTRKRWAGGRLGFADGGGGGLGEIDYPMIDNDVIERQFARQPEGGTLKMPPPPPEPPKEPGLIERYVNKRNEVIKNLGDIGQRVSDTVVETRNNALDNASAWVDRQLGLGGAKATPEATPTAPPAIPDAENERRWDVQNRGAAQPLRNPPPDQPAPAPPAAPPTPPPQQPGSLGTVTTAPPVAPQRPGAPPTNIAAPPPPAGNLGTATTREAPPTQNVGPPTFDIVWGNLTRRESGNTQHNPRTGRPVTGAAGEIGKGQIMPTTAPEAAKYAGLDWNPELFFRPLTGDPVKDKETLDYNDALSRAYLKHQIDYFGGDIHKGAAAYNGGAGTVESAVRRATQAGNPGNWFSFLPSGVQNYVNDVTRSGGASPANAGGQGSSNVSVAANVPGGTSLGGAGTSATNGTTPAPAAGASTGVGAASTTDGLPDIHTARSLWGKKNGDWWDRNESFLVPLLSGIGGMLSSPSHTLAGSIGSGLVAGAGSYGTLGQRQQQIDIGRAGQENTQRAQLLGVYEKLIAQRSSVIANGGSPAQVAAIEAQMRQIEKMVGLGGLAPGIGAGGGATPVKAPGSGSTTGPGQIVAPPTATPQGNVPASMARPDPTFPPDYESKLHPNQRPNELRRRAEALNGTDPTTAERLRQEANTIQADIIKRGGGLAADGVSIVPLPDNVRAFQQAEDRIPENNKWRMQQAGVVTTRRDMKANLEHILQTVQTFEPSGLSQFKNELASVVSGIPALNFRPPTTSTMNPAEYQSFLKNVAMVIKAGGPNGETTGDANTDAARDTVRAGFANPNLEPLAVRRILADSLSKLEHAEAFYRDASDKIDKAPWLDRTRRQDEFNQEPGNTLDERYKKYERDIAVRGDLPNDWRELIPGKAYIATPEDLARVFANGTPAQWAQKVGGNGPRRYRAVPTPNGQITFQAEPGR